MGQLVDMFGRPITEDGNPTAGGGAEPEGSGGIGDLYDAMGVDRPPEAYTAKEKANSWVDRQLGEPDEWTDAEIAGVDLMRMASTSCQIELLEHTEKQIATFCSVPYPDRETFARVTEVQEEIGWPGTKVFQGRISVEFNSRLQPVTVRGSWGSPGIYEELKRVDPGTFKHLNETASLSCGATYDPVIPDKADRWLVDIVKRTHRAIVNMGRGAGFRKWKEHASTINAFGFAPFELVWAREEGKDDELFPDGFVRPWNAAYRDPAGVYEWVFNERQTKLVGAIFQAVSDRGRSQRYALTAGETFETARLLVLNIGAIGLNVEGIPPLRPTVGLRRLKELLLQLYGLGWQKHGVPIPVITIELMDAAVADLVKIGSTEHNGQIQTAVKRLQKMRARLPPVLEMPPGAKLEYISPQKELPDLVPMLEYIDLQIALAFSNEGAMLGTQTGSYALAAAKENSFLRSAPAYAESIAQGLEDWMGLAIMLNHPDPMSIEEWPSYNWRFQGTQESSRWAKDMATLRTAGIESASEEIRAAAAGVMGLSATAFDPPKPEPVAGGEVDADGQAVAVVGQAEKIADTALNGAQVLALVDIVTKVAIGALPRDAAIEVIATAFVVSAERAAELLGSAGLGFDPVSTEAIAESVAEFGAWFRGRITLHAQRTQLEGGGEVVEDEPPQD